MVFLVSQKMNVTLDFLLKDFFLNWILDFLFLEDFFSYYKHTTCKPSEVIMRNTKVT